MNDEQIGKSRRHLIKSILEKQSKKIEISDIIKEDKELDIPLIPEIPKEKEGPISREEYDGTYSTFNEHGEIIRVFGKSYEEYLKWYNEKHGIENVTKEELDYNPEIIKKYQKELEEIENNNTDELESKPKEEDFEK